VDKNTDSKTETGKGKLAIAWGIGRLSGFSSLEECLREVVRDTLTRLFGSVATESIIEYSISKSLNLKGEKSLVENPETFSQALHTILESSYTPVEKLILKDLYLKLGLEYEEIQGYKFADYIRELRGRFDQLK